MGTAVIYWPASSLRSTSPPQTCRPMFKGLHCPILATFSLCPRLLAKTCMRRVLLPEEKDEGNTDGRMMNHSMSRNSKPTDPHLPFNRAQTTTGKSKTHDGWPCPTVSSTIIYCLPMDHNGTTSPAPPGYHPKPALLLVGHRRLDNMRSRRQVLLPQRMKRR